MGACVRFTYQFRKKETNTYVLKIYHYR